MKRWSQSSRMIRYILVVWLSSILWIGNAAATGVCEREFAEAARRHGVPLAVLKAVGDTETGRGDGLRPYALNIEGKAYYDLDRAKALKLFFEARRKGTKLIDLGCMQINHHYHKQHFSSVSEMLEPKKNVDYAAQFLRKLFEDEGNWTMAVARYHAGKYNLKAQRRYVCAVIRKLVAAGEGRWTPAAAEFCNHKQSGCKYAKNRQRSQGKLGVRNYCGSSRGAAVKSRKPRQGTQRAITGWSVTVSTGE